MRVDFVDIPTNRERLEMQKVLPYITDVILNALVSQQKVKGFKAYVPRSIRLSQNETMIFMWLRDAFLNDVDIIQKVPHRDERMRWFESLYSPNLFYTLVEEVGFMNRSGREKGLEQSYKKIKADFIQKYKKAPNKKKTGT